MDIFHLLPALFSWLKANWLEVIKTVSGVVGFIVIIGAPLSNAFKFIKARTYASRIELAVAGSVFAADGDTYLQISVKMKNIGASGVAINPAPSYIAVSTLEKNNTPVVLMPRNHFALLDVFLYQEWLEAGERVQKILFCSRCHTASFLLFTSRYPSSLLADGLPSRKRAIKRPGASGCKRRLSIAN